MAKFEDIQVHTVSLFFQGELHLVCVRSLSWPKRKQMNWLSWTAVISLQQARKHAKIIIRGKFPFSL